MKNVTQILKKTSIKIVLIGLISIFSLNSCSKDEQKTAKETELSEKNWYKKEYQAIFNDKEYTLKLEYQEKGRGIKLDPSTPKEIVNFFIENEKTLIAHVVNEKVYYYANQRDFDKHVIFSDSKIENRLKSQNGGQGKFLANPLNSPGLNGVQYDYLNKWAAMGGGGGIPQNSTWSWCGITGWVGYDFNDAITVVGAVHLDKTEPVNMICFEHATWGGRRIVVSKSSSSLTNYTDLRWVVMGSTFFWTYSWDDEISSHFTLQCPVSILGNVGIVYI